MQLWKPRPDQVSLLDAFPYRGTGKQTCVKDGGSLLQGQILRPDSRILAMHDRHAPLQAEA